MYLFCFTRIYIIAFSLTHDSICIHLRKVLTVGIGSETNLGLHNETYILKPRAQGYFSNQSNPTACAYLHLHDL